ncbi:MAG: ATP-binding protein [Hyphomonadaceae bacterium]|jgi:hypothetical protein|nr:ATP-binding protein [Hyphomonadaceae bacterium]
MTSDHTLEALTVAIHALTARLGASPAPPGSIELDPASSRFVWRDEAAIPVAASPLPLDLLLGMDRQKGLLMANLTQFAGGLPANHAMLWGAPGTGKSALVKSAHAALLAGHPELALVEVPRDGVDRVGPLLAGLEGQVRPALVFIDDLSFSPQDQAYRSLKTVLDGGLSARPGLGRVLVVVTSNLRHLIDRDAMTSTQARAQRPDEVAYEQLALSDRFGLWLGFHPMDQETYLAVVNAYCTRFKLKPREAGLRQAALQWAQMRGSRSGRSAWQFVLDRAGQMGRAIAL